MTNITIFEPETSSSLFSSQDALRIAAVMEALEGLENYEALLFNLTDDADQFALNKAVNEKIEAEGNSVLPITVVDGEIVKSGGYPTNDEITSYIGVRFIEERKALVVAEAVVVAVRRNLPKQKKKKKKKKKNQVAVAAKAKKAAVAAVDRVTIIIRKKQLKRKNLVAAVMDTITTSMRKLQQQVRAHAVVDRVAVASTHKKDSYLGIPRIEFLFPA